MYKYDYTEIFFSERDEQILNSLYCGDALKKRGAEIFQLLLLKKDFKLFVARIRKQMGISGNTPETHDIYHLSDESMRYLKEGYIADGNLYPARFSIGEQLDDEVYEYVKHIVPLVITDPEDKTRGTLRIYEDIFSMTSARIIATEYIIMSNIFMLGCEVGSVHYDEHPQKIERKIRFEFMAGTSKAEVLDYINNNWKSVKIIQRKILDTQSTKRKKAYTRFPEDVRIYNAYIKNRATPPSQRSSSSGYLELSTANDLKADGISVESGAISSIVNRMKRKIVFANRPPSFI
ncbi:MAG: hypothetical protein WC802_00420 [Patescibacteria group bacterium]|jgi:hypothetical protein